MTDNPYYLLDNICALKKNRLFSQVTTSELRGVAAVIEQLEFKVDEEIVKEGDIDDSLYLIKRGKVRVVKKNGNTKSVLTELFEGDCFGEMAAIDEEVRSASVFASEQCVLLRINRDDLKEVVLDCPLIGFELLRIFVKRLRAANEYIEKMKTAVQKINDV